MTTFVRVVEAGSLSAAAKQLRVSTAAASRHLAALEAEVGTSLLARTTRKMSLTSTGKLYYERCLKVLRDVDEAQSVARSGLDGPLRVSMPVSIGFLAGAPLLQPLLAARPGLQIDVRLEDRVVDLVLENVDVAIRVALNPPLSAELVAVPLSRWTRIVVAAPSYLRRHGEPKLPAALASHAALSSAREAATETWTLLDGARTARVQMRSRCTSNAGHLLRDLAVEGLGVCLLPAWFVEPELKSKRLRRILPAWESEPVVVHALYRASLRNEQRVRLLVDHLRGAYARHERDARSSATDP